MSNKIVKLTAIIALMGIWSCSDYLNVVPDDIPTMEHAFSNRTSTEKFLFTCYSYLPNPAEAYNTPGPLQSRECWMHPMGGSAGYWAGADDAGNSMYTYRVAKGEQTANAPLINQWDGGNGGSALFTAIRDCNIFLENINKPTGISDGERKRWVAEVKFLKAYYHFLLLRQYGPIPVIRENLPIAALPDEVRVFRDPVEDAADYIVSLLDDAAAVLDPVLMNETEEMGRITKVIALAVKAQVLTMMASPLFNGNPYALNYVDSRGTLLFPQTADAGKWATAATAIKAAIDCAEQEGSHQLFTFTVALPVAPSVIQEMDIRGAISERWNKEILWGSVKDDDKLQRMANVRTQSDALNLVRSTSVLAATLDAAELFYTDNGLPLAEDRDYIQKYPDIYATSAATAADNDYIRQNFVTANLNFKREPRYYASLSFDGGYYFGNSNNRSNVDMKSNGYGGGTSERYSITGYLPKKLVNRESVLSPSGFTSRFYSYPFIRLADLYLLYAEALNEMKAAPDAEVYEYIDRVRTRAGLKGVEETWKSAASLHPEYIASKDRMRDIIHRERLIELAFENAPYWDILRWMEAETRWNKPVRGWYIYGNTTASYYRVTTVGNSTFSYRDYFTPISQTAIDRNPNLKQNPGW